MAAPMSAETSAIEIRALSKWFGAFKALDDLDLAVARGERLVICGPSGSGKSTLIRTVNALESFDEGEVVVEGVRLTREPATVEAVRRGSAWCSSSSTSSRT